MQTEPDETVPGLPDLAESLSEVVGTLLSCAVDVDAAVDDGSRGRYPRCTRVGRGAARSTVSRLQHVWNGRHLDDATGAAARSTESGQAPVGSDSYAVRDGSVGCVDYRCIVMGIQRRIMAAVAATVFTVSLAACNEQDPALTVGDDGSVESRTAAAVYAGALARTGLKVQPTTEPAPQTELLDQVASGDLGLFPAYTGDLLGQLTPEPKALSADDVLADVNRSLPQQVSIGDPSLVSNRWQVLAGQQAIEISGVETLADCGKLSKGKPFVVTRTPPQPVLKAVSVCHTTGVQQVATTTELMSKVRSDEALGLTTALDSASVEDLTDVQALQSDGAPIAQQLVPVFVSGRMEKPQLKALSRVAGELTTADLAQMMRKVRGGADPRAVAGQWLSTNGV